MKIHLSGQFTSIIFVFLLMPIFCFAEMKFKAVDLTYQVRDSESGTGLEFSKMLSSSEADNFRIIAGCVYYNGVQPVAIFQNISNETLTFYIRMKMFNIDAGKFIYNRLIVADSACLAIPPGAVLGCTGVPNIFAKYCSVSGEPGNYIAEQLPFPGEKNLSGIPPGGYVQVFFPPNEPGGEWNKDGDNNLECFIMDEDNNIISDTLKKNLNIVIPRRPRILYPYDFVIKVPVDTVFYWEAVDYVEKYKIFLCKKNNPEDTLIFYSNDNSIEIKGLEPKTDYLWWIRHIIHEGECQEPGSDFTTFTTDKILKIEEFETKINEVEINPLPASDFIKIKFETGRLSKTRIILSDYLGNEVVDYNYGLTGPGIQDKSIPVSHMADGIYHLILFFDNIYVIKEIVILK